MFADVLMLMLTICLISASAATINDIRTQKPESKTSPVYYGAIMSLMCGILTMLWAVYKLSQAESVQKAMANLKATEAAQAAAQAAAAAH
jgi:archaellum biogenesis protein FlaJ (TadC family)